MLKNVILYIHTSKRCLEKNNIHTPGVQSGRTLTEMLGTLAIIGILSVTGIALFHTVMNSLHANTLLYEINKRAHACAFEVTMMERNPCQLSEYPKKIDDKYDVSVFRLSKNSFEIQLSNVPEALCTKVLNQGLPMAGEIFPKTCEQTNTLRFLFNQELSGNAADLCRDCPAATPHCCSGMCCECQTDADCTENAIFGSGYTCQFNMCMEAEVPDWCAACRTNGQFCNYNDKSTTEGECADATASTLETRDGKTYYTKHQQTSWYGAKSFCAMNHMHLVPLEVLCPNDKVGERCSNFPYKDGWYWTSTPSWANGAYIANAVGPIKNWTKTGNGGGVRPLCAP